MKPRRRLFNERTLSVRLTKPTYQVLRRYADESGLHIYWVLERAVKHYFHCPKINHNLLKALAE